MANWNGFVLTQTGQNLLAKAEEGKRLTFTKIELGDGQVQSGQDITKFTKLINKQLTVGISSVNAKGDGTVVISGIVSNAGMKTGVWVREFGLFATVEGGSEGLFAIMMDTAPDYLPALTEGKAPITVDYNVVMGIGNASDVTVKVDPAGLVTVEVLNEKLAAESEAREKEVNILSCSLAEFTNSLRLLKEKTEALQGFIVEADLTNTQNYPFNSSVKTLALTGDKVRLNQNYTIIVEATQVIDGFLGDVVVSDKLLNGFKVAYTGSAKSAHVKCYVQGGND
ncbi:phage tail protein [Phascolarctobacterium sp.]|uniref:phage tail-collar fiber domain-containing protein n=1 Tax=Phascolarctobacterium sp. TaxID=2049039 RepID=UPI0025F76A40|nr:phage tail protein [Phascolarctobacterium sp.]